MKAWTMLLVGLLVVGLVGMAGAAQAGKAKGGKKKAQQAPERTDAIVGVVAAAPAKGEAAGTWIVKVATGRRPNQRVADVTADSSTQVVIADQPSKIEDLKVGYEVTVTPPTGTAKKIEVAGAKK